MGRRFLFILSGFLLPLAQEIHAQKCSDPFPETPTFVLLAPYSSGDDGPEELRARFGLRKEEMDSRRVRIVAIHPAHKLIPEAAKTFSLNAYDESLHYDADNPAERQALIERLSQYGNVVQVWGMSEEGVLPAAEIGTALKETYPALKANAPALTLRNKLAAKRKLVEALKSSGFQDLVVGDFTGSSQVEDIVEWSRSYLARDGKVVLKGPEGAATRQTYIAHSVEEVRKFGEKILREPNFFNRPNKEIMAEEFTPGVEYGIQSVRSGDKMVTTDVLTYDPKEEVPGAATAYGAIRLVEETDPVVARLVRATRFVQDVLGYTEGSAHVEFYVGLDGRLYFGELNSRLAGLNWHRLVNACVSDGRGQLAVQVDAELAATNFAARDPIYKLKQQGAVVVLSVLEEGHHFLGHLPEFEGIDLNKVDWVLQPSSWHYGTGDEIRLAADLTASLGYVYITAADKETLRARIKFVQRALANKAFFKNKP